MGALIPPAVLLDEALAAYIDCRDDERAVADAYARWSEAPGVERSLRFGAYVAVLDEQQTVAAVCAKSTGGLYRWLPDEPRGRGFEPCAALR